MSYPVFPTLTSRKGHTSVRLSERQIQHRTEEGRDRGSEGGALIADWDCDKRGKCSWVGEGEDARN